MREQSLPPFLLDERDAADYLGLSVRLLQKYRQSGDGPVFLKIGRMVRYRVDDLRSWASERVRSSTSDSGPQAA